MRFSFYSNFGRGIAVLTGIFALTTTVGCGSGVRTPQPALSTVSSSNGITTGPTTGNTPLPGGNIPVQRFTLEGTGYDTQTIRVQAGFLLKVQYIPALPSRKVTATGIVPRYSKMGVYISVGSLTQPTEMLSTGLNGGQAQLSRVLDFSGGLTGCASQPFSCRSMVTITISKPNNDFQCIYQGAAFCPWTRVPADTPWSGALLVQTDDTDRL